VLSHGITLPGRPQANPLVNRKIPPGRNTANGILDPEGHRNRLHGLTPHCRTSLNRGDNP